MGGFPILTLTTFLLLAGAILIMLVRTATAGSSDGSEYQFEFRDHHFWRQYRFSNLTASRSNGRSRQQ